MAASEKVERELSLYRAEQPAGLDSNPLKWWKGRKLTYPSLLEKDILWLPQVFLLKGYLVL